MPQEDLIGPHHATLCSLLNSALRNLQGARISESIQQLWTIRAVLILLACEQAQQIKQKFTVEEKRRHTYHQVTISAVSAETFHQLLLQLPTELLAIDDTKLRLLLRLRISCEEQGSVIPPDFLDKLVPRLRDATSLPLPISEAELRALIAPDNAYIAPFLSCLGIALCQLLGKETRKLEPDPCPESFGSAWHTNLQLLVLEEYIALSLQQLNNPASRALKEASDSCLSLLNGLSHTQMQEREQQNEALKQARRLSHVINLCAAHPVLSEKFKELALIIFPLFRDGNLLEGRTPLYQGVVFSLIENYAHLNSTLHSTLNTLKTSSALEQADEAALQKLIATEETLLCELKDLLPELNPQQENSLDFFKYYCHHRRVYSAHLWAVTVCLRNCDTALLKKCPQPEQNPILALFKKNELSPIGKELEKVQNLPKAPFIPCYSPAFFLRAKKAIAQHIKSSMGSAFRIA